MTKEHLNALLAAAEAKAGENGYQQLQEGRHITLYVASNGGSLTIGKIVKLQVADGGVLFARTARDETYTALLADVFAGSVDPPPTASRKAGFV